MQLLSDIDSRSASTAEVLTLTLNHWRPCSCRCRSTCLEQSSSRSAPIRDIFYFRTHLKSHLFNISYPDCYQRLFLYRAESACAAYASLNLSLLHYITLQRVKCVKGSLTVVWRILTSLWVFQSVWSRVSATRNCRRRGRVPGNTNHWVTGAFLSLSSSRQRHARSRKILLCLLSQYSKQASKRSCLRTDMSFDDYVIEYYSIDRLN